MFKLVIIFKGKQIVQASKFVQLVHNISMNNKYFLDYLEKEDSSELNFISDNEDFLNNILEDKFIKVLIEDSNVIFNIRRIRSSSDIFVLKKIGVPYKKSSVRNFINKNLENLEKAKDSEEYFFISNIHSTPGLQTNIVESYYKNNKDIDLTINFLSQFNSKDFLFFNFLSKSNNNYFKRYFKRVLFSDSVKNTDSYGFLI